MKEWFYIKQGKTMGPIALEDLFELIDLQDICTSDLLSLNKSPWQYAYEFKEVYDYFSKKSLKVQENKDWVVMKFLPCLLYTSPSPRD